MISIKPFRIEILIAGFSHLLGLTLLGIYFSGESPYSILIFLSNLKSETAVFLLTIIAGISFFLGTLAEHSLIVLNYCLNNKEGKKKIIESYKGTPEGIWTSKIFFLSMTISGLFLIIGLLLLDNKFKSYNVYWTIFIIGILIELVTFISFLFWRQVSKIKLKNNS